MYKYLFLIFAVFSPVGFLMGQDQEVSPKVASQFFDAGKYQEAKAVYKILLDKYSRNPQYNYYYGVTLCLTKDDYSEAIRRLKFAAMSGTNKDVNYYLGRAFQMTYEFVEAKKCYVQFKKVASLGDVRVQNATKYIQECEYGMLNTTRYYPLTVIDKDTVNRKKILSLYYPSKDVGSILRNSDFFQSGVDPDGIMYITERQDEAYFSLFSTGSKGQDLFKMVKLLDGWSDNDALPSNINTPFDEVFPFLASNGTTLYYSTNKPGGFGGFDIYKTEYNVASKTFSDPVNMGIPFNSPDDDFLFVSDEFNSVGWFASNRETSGDVVMVYKFKWDNKVAKVNVSDIGDIKTVAKLDVSMEAIKEAQRKGDFTYQSAQAKARTGAQFKFVIDDTLTYTNFDQFKSSDALEYYKKGYSKLQKRDSLNAKMREKRAVFQMSNDVAVKDQMVVEILKMEKELYGYDDVIEESNFVARRLEIEKIREMIGKGNYKASKISTPNTYSLSDDVELNPEAYQFYSEEAFVKRAQTYAPMYENVFDDSDIEKLKQADSLYVWGSILTLEASSLLDKSAHSTQSTELRFKKAGAADSGEGQSTEMLLAESKKLKEVSLRYLLTSLDEKFAVYSLKLGEIIPRISADKGQRFSDESGRANAYFREGSNMYSADDALEYSQIEKVIGLKKMAVDTQDKILFDYANSSKQGWTLASSSKETQPKYSAPKAKVTPTAASEPEVVAVTPKSSVPMVKENNDLGADGLVYKIQIGVFRNTPSADMLSLLTDVTSEPVEGKDVTKYYSGKYATADEAISHISSVKEAGFPSAYLVAFFNGKQIELSKAKILEGK